MKEWSVTKGLSSKRVHYPMLYSKIVAISQINFLSQIGKWSMSDASFIPFSHPAKLACFCFVCSPKKSPQPRAMVHTVGLYMFFT